MKKYCFLLLLFTAFSLSTGAQTNKGQWMLGSTVGLSASPFLNVERTLPDNHAGLLFNTTNVDVNGRIERLNSTAVHIAPAVGYFVAKGFMAGLNMSYSFTKTEEAKLTFLSFTPVLRNYFLLNGKTRPFIEARGGVIYRKLPGEPEDTYPVVGGRGGAAIFVNDQVSIDLFVDYSYVKDNQRNDDEMVDATNSLLGFGVGFSYFW